MKSKKIEFRVTKELKEKAHSVANDMNVSLSTLMTIALSEYLSKKGKAS